MLKEYFLGLLMLGFPLGMGVAPGFEPDVWWGPRNLEMAFYNIPINLSFVKYAQRIVSGVADAGVPPGDEDGSCT